MLADAAKRAVSPPFTVQHVFDEMGSARWNMEGANLIAPKVRLAITRPVSGDKSETITRGEHKHPRIEASADTLLFTARFKANVGINVHVPDRGVN